MFTVPLNVKDLVVRVGERVNLAERTRPLNLRHGRLEIEMVPTALPFRLNSVAIPALAVKMALVLTLTGDWTPSRFSEAKKPP